MLDETYATSSCDGSYTRGLAQTTPPRLGYKRQACSRFSYVNQSALWLRRWLREPVSRGAASQSISWLTSTMSRRSHIFLWICFRRVFAFLSSLLFAWVYRACLCFTQDSGFTTHSYLTPVRPLHKHDIGSTTLFHATSHISCGTIMVKS